MELGNNIKSLQVRKVSIPFFDDQGNTTNGQRYYFPEHPEIDNKTVVGIEAHLTTSTFFQGDSRQVFNNGASMPVSVSDYVYLCFYNKENEEVFYNVPLKSIFGKNSALGTSPKQKIKPYFGKLKTRNCYAYAPANSPILIVGNYYIILTFYLR